MGQAAEHIAELNEPTPTLDSLMEESFSWKTKSIYATLPIWSTLLSFIMGIYVWLLKLSENKKVMLIGPVLLLSLSWIFWFYFGLYVIF
jgi:hypothetical protein